VIKLVVRHPRKKEKNGRREREKDREIQNVSLRKKRQTTRFGEVTSTLFNLKVAEVDA